MATSTERQTQGKVEKTFFTLTNLKNKTSKKSILEHFQRCTLRSETDLGIEIPLKMKTNFFYFTLKAFVALAKKAQINFKVYETTDYEANSWNTHIN